MARLWEKQEPCMAPACFNHSQDISQNGKEEAPAAASVIGVKVLTGLGELDGKSNQVT